MNWLLRNMNNDKPREIHRAIRSLDDLSYWKGTELRSFLLYFGVVVLKDYLPSDVYRHFLDLVCATTICYDIYWHIAKTYFERYVERFGDIYGIHGIGSNVHLLTHVYDDVKLFGNLNSISAYPFESRLNFLKLRLKQPKLPLEQITRRVIELSLDYDQLYTQNFETDIFPKLKYSDTLNGTNIYKEIAIDSGCTFSTNRCADSWILTIYTEIVQMKYVV